MAFITYPLNNIDYTAEDAELFHCTRTSGIWAENSFPISVTGADNNVTIGTGIAWINNEEFSGKVTALKSAEVLDLGIADSAYPRIDVIAIQFNANNNETDIIVKKGTPATNPVRPAIVRSGAVYELYLASVYRPAGATAITASNITDLRMDATVCGLMADSVTKIDMDAIRAQLTGLVEELEEAIQNIEVGEIVPIKKGGTGATSAVEALANLGGVSKKLLWENASPVSDFGAQSISLNLSEYDAILLQTCAGSGFDCSYFVKKSDWSKLGTLYGSSAYPTQRTAVFSDSGIRFGDGEYISSAWVTGNTYLKPLRIYGIKGVQ